MGFGGNWAGMGALYDSQKVKTCTSVTGITLSHFKDLNLDMISMNAQGLRHYTKRRKVFNFMKKHASSKGIIFMQETHSLKRCENTWTNQFGCGNNHIVFSHGTSESRGVLIAFREASNYKVINQYVDGGGRLIVLNTLIEDSPVVYINYYAPNEEKDQLKAFDDLNHILDNTDISEDTVLVWGGGFNLIFDIRLDADGGSPKLNLQSIYLRYPQ